MVFPTWVVALLRWRFELGIVLFVLGIAANWYPGPEWAWLLYVPGALFIVTHILFGTVGAASQILQSGDIPAARAMLKRTLNPKWLYTTQRSYYYMLEGAMQMGEQNNAGASESIKRALENGLGSPAEQSAAMLQLGMVAFQEQNWKEADDYLRRALKSGLGNDEQAMANLALGAIAARRQNLGGAKVYIERAKALKPENEEIRKQIAEMEKQLKQGPRQQFVRR